MGVFFADPGNAVPRVAPHPLLSLKPEFTPPGPDIEQGSDEVADEQESE